MELFCECQVYHTKFPVFILEEWHPICHLEALNAVAELQHLAPQCTGQLVHLFSDSAKAVAIFQASRGKDAFIQACARELWLTCEQFNITLGVSHTPGEGLTLTADAFSHWHTSQLYKTESINLSGIGG